MYLEKSATSYRDRIDFSLIGLVPYVCTNQLALQDFNGHFDILTLSSQRSMFIHCWYLGDLTTIPTITRHTCSRHDCYTAGSDSRKPYLHRDRPIYYHSKTVELDQGMELCSPTRTQPPQPRSGSPTDPGTST